MLQKSGTQCLDGKFLPVVRRVHSSWTLVNLLGQ
ncbi:hypothetical protein PRBEI_2000478500 [Prionailurus iriomotensis]